ncbi:cupredoxin domain-containing protein [Pseudaminobacter soli (ex Li et al. 2025)]|uniref:Amicyanin n=1 Tax=Pseudaminobacter soli (ex Li et al. 2025) TaxID=1295366 RepID=A0A2P7RPW8_9HYPH|nr:cupredoxin domain-containing protein [Mesorhizobium soli]PSJ52225.1 amicyanin [Mesorhizobium soli]
MLSKSYLLITAVLALIVSDVAQAKTIQVTIKNRTFAPAEIHAKVGDTVEWVNEDPVPHTATTKGGWNLNIPPKKTASEVMKKAGEFNYHCSVHPSMKGHISVAAQ